MSSSNFIRSSGSSTAETNDSTEFILELGLERKMCVKMEVNIVGIKRISRSLLKLSKLLTRPLANWVLSPWSHAWFRYWRKTKSACIRNYILVPRGRDPFGQDKRSRPLADQFS